IEQHGGSEAFAPVQFLAQHSQIAIARRVDELDRVLGSTDEDTVAFLEVALQLTVEMQPRLDRVLERDLDHRAIADHDGPVGQSVRGYRNQREAGHPGLDDGPVGRESVCSRAGGRRYDQAVRAQVVDKLAVDVDDKLDQPPDRALVDHGVIEGKRREGDRAAAAYLGGEPGALLDGMLSGEDL